MSFIIEYQHGQLCGGLGDRVVGLVSAVLLAQGTGKQLLIKWDAPSLHGLIDLGPYNYYNRPGIPKNAIILNAMNRRFDYETLLSQENLPHVWQGRTVILRTNHEIASFWYRNPHRNSGGCVNGSDFETDARTVYQEIFTKYLRPTFSVPSLIPVNQNYWACQVRTGDVALNVGCHHPIPYIEVVISSLVPFLQARQPPPSPSSQPLAPPKFLYVSSDHPQVATLLRQAMAPDWQVIDCPASRVHFERSNISSLALQALITDVFMLAHASKNQLIISAQSNFGRLIALSRPTINTETLWGFYKYPYIIESIIFNNLYTQEPIRWMEPMPLVNTRSRSHARGSKSRGLQINKPRLQINKQQRPRLQQRPRAQFQKRMRTQARVRTRFQLRSRTRARTRSRSRRSRPRHSTIKK